MWLPIACIKENVCIFIIDTRQSSYTHTNTCTHTSLCKYLAGGPPRNTIRASESAMLTLWRVINAITLNFFHLHHIEDWHTYIWYHWWKHKIPVSLDTLHAVSMGKHSHIINIVIKERNESWHKMTKLCRQSYSQYKNQDKRRKRIWQAYLWYTLFP